ncbi:STM4015 family protein [Actinomadura atramentaria]|uniref:STM4015 family protein n=1 Tax=Actinomadura atramentaria TaxID=1990 RepID=UPI0003692143|nr:STM4015 family protein [Actinomadura atramentaria]
MPTSTLIGEYAGLPVAEFDVTRLPASAAELPAYVKPLRGTGGPLPPAAGHAWRLRAEYDQAEYTEVWEAFLDTVDTTEVTALIIGYWGISADDVPHPAPMLAEAADRFPNLRALFLGEVLQEEDEISWIEHEDITSLITAFPALERLDVRGSEGLGFDPITSTALRTLRLESGGLPRGIVESVAASELPALEHLDLWLGVEHYGGDTTVADLAPFLDGARFPALRRLGLEDSPAADEIAAAVASAPVVARLESLSLALGALSDDGAAALLSGQPLTHLRELDLHHHFISEPMMERVRAALPGVAVNLDDPYSPDVWDDAEDRFVAVSE